MSLSPFLISITLDLATHEALDKQVTDHVQDTVSDAVKR